MTARMTSTEKAAERRASIELAAAKARGEALLATVALGKRRPHAPAPLSKGDRERRDAARAIRNVDRRTAATAKSEGLSLEAYIAVRRDRRSRRRR
jgi:predicted ABC-type transport system involved in lysophospholipase L1 biosynthesis ATPase subunit